MNSPILFSEKQRFNQWWLWLILIVPVGLTIINFFQDSANHAGQGFSASLVVNSFWLILPFLLIIVFILVINLTTQIKEDGIYVKFFPFHLKVLFFPWEQLEKVYVRKYAPLKEYGGWGLRLGIFGSGKAYNVKGNRGLQLVLKEGGKILIGTQQPEALENALKSIGRLIS